MTNIPDLLKPEEFEPIAHALDRLSSSGQEDRGAIFTKREVVCFILSLVGYTSQKELYLKRILEPSFGHGEFLVEIVNRLLKKFTQDFDPPTIKSETLDLLKSSIRAVELHRDSFEHVKLKLLNRLEEAGFSNHNARSIVDAWLQCGDFLFSDLNSSSFDFVVGNPPYVRQEAIPNVLLKEYRKRFLTMCDRADLYVAFTEKSLSLLGKNGLLGFICADRWTKNKYGRPLRELISRDYHLEHYISMTDADAFHQEVSAYPSVAVIKRAKGTRTRIAKLDRNLSELRNLVKEIKAKSLANTAHIQEIEGVDRNGAPWILNTDPTTNLVRRLESELPLVEQAGAEVRIGVATGADRIYTQPFASLAVEPGRKLKLAVTRDIKNGSIQWTGTGIVNPFLENGSLAAFDKFPRMAKFFRDHELAIKGRNVAKRNAKNWYRTIDRIYPQLATVPKLLIPDIRGEATIVYEDLGLYPHHNFYFITSTTWDLRVLQAVLLSGLARLFVGAYTTKMRGGYLRYQAQHLRRIRIPWWNSLDQPCRSRLRDAAIALDSKSSSAIVAKLLGLSNTERSALEGSIP